MNKLLLLICVAIVAVGCSKDRDIEIQENEISGMWTATSVVVLYQNTDGSPYRDETITEDVHDNNPEFGYQIDGDYIRSIGKMGTYQAIRYILEDGYIVTFGGQRVKYTLDGDSMEFEFTELNIDWFNNDIIIPKVIETVTLIKEERI